LSDNIKVNPVYIVVFAFCAVIVLLFINFFVVTFLNVNLGAMFPAGSSGNAIYGNGIVAKNFYNTGYSDIQYSMAIILLAGLIFDAVSGWFAPSKLKGIMNILLIFVGAYLWLTIKGTITGSLTFLLNVGTVPNVLYSLIVSPYFIMVVAAMLAISAVFNFRSVEEAEVEDRGIDRAYFQEDLRG
jgi:hypothetical protein